MGIGVESTIVDVSGQVPVVLRPGAITMEMLRETLGEVTIDPAILGPMAEGVRPKAPGMKYKGFHDSGTGRTHGFHGMETGKGAD